PSRATTAGIAGLTVGLAVLALISPRLPAIMAEPSATPAVTAQKAAPAGTWQVDRTQSTLGFIASGGGTELKGSFIAYDATITFDPADPGATRVDVTIDMTSAKTVSGQYDDTLKGSDWFDTETHPSARFTAAKAMPGSDSSQFVLDGSLTLRGVTAPVQLPFTFTDNGDGSATATVAHTISRNAFGVGPTEGFAGAVKDDVQLNFALRATRTEGQ
ncbi:MAG: YceI family protein, partial [Pseudomonadota bacterium]